MQYHTARAWLQVLTWKEYKCTNANNVKCPKYTQIHAPLKRFSYKPKDTIILTVLTLILNSSDNKARKMLLT